VQRQFKVGGRARPSSYIWNAEL